MRNGDRHFFGGSWRRAAGTLGVLAFAVAIIAIARRADGNPPGVGQSRAEIEDLAFCYAAGTDAIARGDVQGGKAIYQGCFTSDAVVKAYLPTSDPNGPPDISGIGPDGWGDTVEATFTGAGYTGTQHLMGNIRIHIQGNTATMTSYLTATHVLQPFTTIDLATGTYDDVVVHTPAGWRIAQRTLRILTFQRVQSPSP